MLQQESLSATVWDAIIFGTGLTESLIAAALSKAGKKVLHVDTNDHYGGAYSSFSLDELRSWVAECNSETLGLGDDGNTKAYQNLYPGFSDAVLDIPDETATKLEHSRSYSLSLWPQILYAESSLLPILVKVQLHQNLEFLKVGNWFVGAKSEVEGSGDKSTAAGTFKKVPNGREDVFLDKSIDLRTKRGLVKVLKNVILNGADSGSSGAEQGSIDGVSFESHLTTPPNSLPPSVIPFVAALTMSYRKTSELPAAVGLQTLRRHAASIGKLGPDFAAVVARYGTTAEIIQVLCRAAAVAGNAVYILGASLENLVVAPSSSAEASGSGEAEIEATFKDQDKVRARNIVGRLENISWDPKIRNMLQPELPSGGSSDHIHSNSVRRAIFVVSGTTTSFLFESKEPPPSSAAVVYFPSGTVLDGDGNPNADGIYLLAHSPDVGHGPRDQCIFYVSTIQAEKGKNIDGLLQSTAMSVLRRDDNNAESETPQILLSVYYTHSVDSYPDDLSWDVDKRLYLLRDARALDMVLPDSVVEEALKVYEHITGSRDAFMVHDGQEYGETETEEA